MSLEMDSQPVILAVPLIILTVVPVPHHAPILIIQRDLVELVTELVPINVIQVMKEQIPLAIQRRAAFNARIRLAVIPLVLLTYLRVDLLIIIQIHIAYMIVKVQSVVLENLEVVLKYMMIQVLLQMIIVCPILLWGQQSV
jgi:hypothetical protein